MNPLYPALAISLISIVLGMWLMLFLIQKAQYSQRYWRAFFFYTHPSIRKLILTEALRKELTRHE